MNQPDQAQLPSWVTSLLRCPVTGAPLRRQSDEEATARPQGADGATGREDAAGTSELVSTAEEHRLAYPLRDGVPVLLADQARPVN